MAEGIAFELVTGVLGKLGTALWDEIGLLRSFKDDADDLRNNFSLIRAVLLDAEERSIVEIKENEPLRIWLSELKGAAYDIDDLLDEIRMQAEKVSGFLSRANPMHLNFKRKMAHRMKELRDKIDKITKQMHDFHLHKAGPSQQTHGSDHRETGPSVEEEKIVGRDDDKEEIVKLLLETTGDHDLSVIPIVGMGGLGKTTLAQLAFNDGRVTAQQVFDLRVWVYVSTDFDMKKIAVAVKSTTRGEGDLTTKVSSETFLRETFSQKRFLLVLDDVWNEDQRKWEELKLLFKDGMKGSKILVTTRSEKAAEIMKTTEQPHRPKGLSDDDCWTLFKRRAFKEGEENNYPSLVDIGKQIVEKCGGVPLAANALGSMMRFKRMENEWSAIKDSKIWELQEEKEILPLLKLSYIQMPLSALKHCFAYCSIFPKGYEIDQDDLIRQWIALGFISSPNTSTLMEDIGNEYCNKLLWGYFLQEVEDGKKFNGKVTYRMHDLMHDLARSVARDEVAVRVVGESTGIPEGCRYASIYSNFVSQVPTTVVRRLRALRYRESDSLKTSLKTFFSEAKCLRLLDLHDCEISVLPSSIGKLKLLRYLNLSSTSIQELPESITGLCNLQTLNLSGCSKIHTLPKFLGRLANLRILNLSGCYCLLSLPSSLCLLKNLHDLNLSNLCDLEALSKSIRNLENLRILNLSNYSRLQSLPSSLCQLKNLHDLNLSYLFDLEALPESIRNLENLRILNLSVCSRLQSLPSSLCQLKNLHDLNLSYLRHLQALPESIGNLENLRILDLSNCSRLLSLPSSLCYLKNIHDLNLSNLNSLETIPESIGNLANLRILNLSMCSRLLSLPSSSSDLRQLEKLDISGCEQLCELPKMIEKLTKLRELLNKDCLELKAMPRGIGKLVSLQELPIFVIGKQDRVEHCASISELEHLKLVGKLEIKGLENVTNPVDAKAANLIEKNLLSLKLKWNVLSAVEDMDNTQPAEEIDVVLENLQPHQNLANLEIEGYAGGKFPSWMMNRIDSCLPNLVRIKLVNIPRCNSLPPLGLLPVLKELIIGDMPAITNLGVEFYGDSHINESANKFPALRRLDLSDMPVDDEEGRRERVPIFPCLTHLTLEKCGPASVESLRSLTALQSLTIENMGDLERIEDWLGELSKLNYLYINDCQSLRYLPAHKMTTLTHLFIKGCPLLFNADGQFVDTNVDHITYVRVDGRYKYKEQVRSLPQEEKSSPKGQVSSMKEEKKSWTRCWR